MAQSGQVEEMPHGLAVAAFWCTFFLRAFASLVVPTWQQLLQDQSLQKRPLPLPLQVDLVLEVWASPWLLDSKVYRPNFSSFSFWLYLHGPLHQIPKRGKHSRSL